ncbi:MAG: hypothetical protein EOM24_23655 [Chloroflexia bacterium]|nr:hypothetical protein [Chloroflexia bacterium]
MIKTWKALEDEIWSSLQDYQRHLHLLAHRFWDSRTAGNLMPDQPADFMAIHTREGKTRVIFIEAKFSEVHDSLRACFAGSVRPNQLASARLARRAGAQYLFVFYSQVVNRFEVWDGQYCAERRALGKPLELPCRTLCDSLEEVIETHALRIERRRPKRAPEPRAGVAR